MSNAWASPKVECHALRQIPCRVRDWLSGLFVILKSNRRGSKYHLLAELVLP